MFQPVAGIRPGRPPFAPSILTAARQIPGSELAANPALRWQTGVASRETTCDRLIEWPRCPAPGHPDKCPPAKNVVTSWDSFIIEQFRECDGPLDLDEQAVLSGELANTVAAGTSSAIARQLWAGTEVAGNPSLVNTAVDLSAGGTIVSGLVGGLGALLAAYDATTDVGFPTIHIPASLLPAAENAQVFAREGSVLIGASGTYVVSPGPAYPGDLGPEDGGGTPIPAPPGTAWMFVSGPVEYAVGETRVIPEQSDRRLNLWSARGQRQALVRIESCGVFAVLVGLNG